MALHGTEKNWRRYVRYTIEEAYEVGDAIGGAAFGFDLKGPRNALAGGRVREGSTFDNQHRDFDFRLVARPARARWQDRSVIVGRHLGVGPIYLRLEPRRYFRR
jgi:hypothetical protein